MSADVPQGGCQVPRCGANARSIPVLAYDVIMVRRRPRAFSLIEVMIVVAIIAVLSAIALPNLLPEVNKAHVNGSADVVAAVLARARGEAMLSKRCVRVWIDSTNTHRIVTERLNTFDCDVAPATFPAGFGGVGLDGVAQVWSPLASSVLDAPSVVLSMLASPSDTTACSTASGSVAGTPAGFSCAHIIFRPNGRIWTQDADADDDAVINVAHPGVTLSKNILINSNGLICTYRLGEAPIGGPGDFTCPN